jgi:uncharacterized protein YndB with AHSA1/START domain
MDKIGQDEAGSDRAFVIERRIHGPVPVVFDAWARPDRFRTWWVPKSSDITLVSHDAEVRTGGRYQLVMRHPSVDEPMAFFGRYIEVTPPTLIVWTNDEGDDEGAVTRVRFEEDGDATRIVVQEIYPSSAARDAAVESGETAAWAEQLDQLDALIAGRSTGIGAHFTAT